MPAGADLMPPSLAPVQQTATPAHNLRGGGARNNLIKQRLVFRPRGGVQLGVAVFCEGVER